MPTVTPQPPCTNLPGPDPTCPEHPAQWNASNVDPDSRSPPSPPSGSQDSGSSSNTGAIVGGVVGGVVGGLALLAAVAGVVLARRGAQRRDAEAAAGKMDGDGGKSGTWGALDGACAACRGLACLTPCVFGACGRHCMRTCGGRCDLATPGMFCFCVPGGRASAVVSDCSFHLVHDQRACAPAPVDCVLFVLCHMPIMAPTSRVPRARIRAMKEH